LLQDAVDKLVAHQKFQKKIQQLRAEIASTDIAIIDFASKLGQLEQKLHEATTDRKTLKDLDGIITKQDFTVDEVMVFAERLGLMSFAPSDYLEQKGMSPQKPPAPQEDTISTSINHLQLPDLLKLVEAEELERKKKQESEKKADEMEIDSLAGKDVEKKDGKVADFKPPPGWKPGDPLRPEHLQYLYKMSTLSRKTTPTSIDPPLKSESNQEPSSLPQKLPPPTVPPPKEVSKPPGTGPGVQPIADGKTKLPSKPVQPPTTAGHSPRPVSSRLNPELDDLGFSSDEEEGDAPEDDADEEEI